MAVELHELSFLAIGLFSIFVDGLFGQKGFLDLKRKSLFFSAVTAGLTFKYLFLISLTSIFLRLVNRTLAE